MRDIWSREIVKQNGVARNDSLPWMSRTTLDVIGLAGEFSYLPFVVLFLTMESSGFNYKFNALSGDPENNELMKAFSTMFKAGQKPSVIPALRVMYPILSFLVRIGIVITCILSSNFALDYSRHQTTMRGGRLLL